MGELYGLPQRARLLPLKIAEILKSLTLPRVYSQGIVADYRDEQKTYYGGSHDTRLILDFRASLTDAISWCSQQARLDDPKNSLRSIEITSELLDRDDQVHQIYHLRSKLLKESGTYPTELVKDLAGGRLALFWPDTTLSDGAACAASQGLFDDDNVPPRDTWVMYIRETKGGFLHRLRHIILANHVPRLQDEYLIVWIPPVFIPLADRGIRVIPEECVIWLDTLDTPFTRLLDANGLLK